MDLREPGDAWADSLDLPDLRTLRIFLCCAEAGSFHKAALRLGVTPQAVSKSINHLEKKLQRRLFDRAGPHTALTAEGQRLRALLREPVTSLHRALHAALHDDG